MALSDKYPIQSPRKGYPEEFRKIVREAYDNRGNRTRKDICEEYGIAPWTLKQWVGPDPAWRETKRQRDQNIDKVREMHWEGCTYHYIAKKTGIPVSTVWDYINRI